MRAHGIDETSIRRRARKGIADAFPPTEHYGAVLFGSSCRSAEDQLDALRLVPPIFTPHRMRKLLDLAREPMYSDVDLAVRIGGFASNLPLYISAFGSTRAASNDLGVAASRQAGLLGVPLVIGENVVPVNGYGRLGDQRSLLARVRSYTDTVPDGVGGVVVQQSTEDADAEVWNLVYSDPSVHSLLASNRLAFELKLGQGAKPGLGGMTLLERQEAAGVEGQYALDAAFGDEPGNVLRSSTPGTFTQEILRQQVRLMRNNFPRARVWVKLPPGRDVREAAAVAWEAGADAVTVDGAEGGTGWAPKSFLEHVGLPLAECLARIGARDRCLLASGRIWEGSRATKCIALGATAVGLGRAALLAADEDPEMGLVRLVDCLAFELRLLISALGKYTVQSLDADDIWWPDRLPGNRATD